MASAGDFLTFQWNFLTSDGFHVSPAIDPDASRDASFVTITGPGGFLFGTTLSNTLDHPKVFPTVIGQILFSTLLHPLIWRRGIEILPWHFPVTVTIRSGSEWSTVVLRLLRQAQAY